MYGSINDSDDPLERMLAVLRFTFSKDLRHVRGKVCKPYNSVLGEHFRSHWDVIPVTYDDITRVPTLHEHVDHVPPATLLPIATASTPRIPRSEAPSIKGGKEGVPPGQTGRFGSLLSMKGWSSPAVDHTDSTPTLSTAVSELSLSSTSESTTPSTPAPARIRVAFLTEQVSHHPPISAFVATCPARSVRLSGIDQIVAKVTSTASVRIGPGAANKGLFVDIGGGFGAGEQYQITHPVAHVNGVLRGSFYVTVGECTIVTCAGGKGRGGEWLRAIIEYKEESWLGKPHFLVEGVIHGYTPGATEHEEWTRVKHVPKARALVYLEGTWRGAVRYRHAFPSAAPSPASSSSSIARGATGTGAGAGTGTEWRVLVDLSTLHVVPKAVRKLEKQLPDESRKLWETVTDGLLKKEYSEATREKQRIEQRQRDVAAERKRKGVEFIPRYFENDIASGVPKLTPAGQAALDEELAEDEADCTP
ncbi:hypothetical protein BV25DRAFT_1825133 [Artomyces pyxidatus]|uniref:Uncharacterized protein n=1 Tax=Artomyces pyxidatus TaxID=48021 RepID=A0ACB8T1R4_9AGAM|nr:hypothetical protein BV25DRAFT_1825133 [Artomyces pyxidatus]